MDEPLEQEGVHCSQGCSGGIMWVWGSALAPQAVIDFRASPDVLLLNLCQSWSSPRSSVSN